MKTIALDIEGMSCDHCIGAVSRALGKLEGVHPKSIRVGRAELQYDENLVGTREIMAAISDEGYAVRPSTS